MTPLMDQMNELRNMVYGYVKNGDSPPPYPTAPPMDPTPLDHIFPGALIEEPEPPRVTRKVYPALRKSKLFRTMFQRNSNKDDRERSDPDLNVDGGVSADLAGITASSIMPQRPTDLIGGQMYAPRHQPSTSGRPLAAPPPPPRHVTFQREQRQQSPPQPRPRPPATEEPDYLPMAMMGPSTSTLQAEDPTPIPARGTLSQRHRPPPLNIILDQGYGAAAGAAGNQQPPTPP